MHNRFGPNSKSCLVQVQFLSLLQLPLVLLYQRSVNLNLWRLGELSNKLQVWLVSEASCLKKTDEGSVSCSCFEMNVESMWM